MDPLTFNFSQILVKSVPVNVLDNYGDPISRIDSIIKFHDSRMVQLTEIGDLSPKSINPIEILAQLSFVILLDGDLGASRPQLASLDQAKGPLPDLDGDFIISQSGLIWAI
jgi:hypothetical protein